MALRKPPLLLLLLLLLLLMLLLMLLLQRWTHLFRGCSRQSIAFSMTWVLQQLLLSPHLLLGGSGRSSSQDLMLCMPCEAGHLQQHLLLLVLLLSIRMKRCFFLRVLVEALKCLGIPPAPQQ